MIEYISLVWMIDGETLKSKLKSVQAIAIKDPTAAKPTEVFSASKGSMPLPICSTQVRRDEETKKREDTGHWKVFNGSSQPQIRELLVLHVVHIVNMASGSGSGSFLSLLHMV